MKILITEQQKIMLTELMWKQPLVVHIRSGRFPLTTKVRKALYGEEEVTTFHISDIDNIDIVKQLIGTKKTLSSFTFMSENMVGKMSGIQTNGGVLYELKGKLVLHSPHDIMSRPDENGYRWIDFDYLLPDKEKNGMYINSLHEIWSEYIRSSKFRNDANMIQDKSYGINRTNFIRYYINKAQDFILNNIDEIKKKLEKDAGWGDWNEILVSNIEVRDVLWAKSKLFDRLDRIKERIEDSGRVPTEKEKRTINDFELWENKIENKLKNVSKGVVYKIDSPSLDVVKKFIKDRGGFIDKLEYKNHNKK